MLNHRNTPNETGASPAQLFLNRCTRTLMPMSQKLLKPKAIDIDSQTKKMAQKQHKSAKYYNAHAKDLPLLEESDNVKLRPYTFRKKKWVNGTITKRLDERSYEVESGDSLYRRNRVHLRKMSNMTTDAPADVPADVPEVQRPGVQENTLTTRPGPAIHMPAPQPAPTRSQNRAIPLDRPTTSGSST